MKITQTQVLFYMLVESLQIQHLGIKSLIPRVIQTHSTVIIPSSGLRIQEVVASLISKQVPKR